MKELETMYVHHYLGTPLRMFHTNGSDFSEVPLGEPEMAIRTEPIPEPIAFLTTGYVDKDSGLTEITVTDGKLLE